MSGHYQRRWQSGTSGTGRTTPTGRSLSATVEPSTYGTSYNTTGPSSASTSWNSVRWNKPATSGYRSHSARIRDAFESKPSSYTSSTASNRASSTPKYTTTNAVQAARDIVSLGPSVTSRASRFDSTVNDKYRSEAREILSKYTSKDRTGTETSSSRATGMSNSYTSPSYSPSTAASSNYRSSITPSRTSVPTYTSRYSQERTSITSPSPQPKERPWRTRMAESARLRQTIGDDASASYSASRASRRNSIGQASGDELSQSLSQLRSYVSRPSYSDGLPPSQPQPSAARTPSAASTTASTTYTPGYRNSSRQSSIDSTYGGSRYSTPYASVTERISAARATEPAHSRPSEKYMSRFNSVDLERPTCPKPYKPRSFSPVRSTINPFPNNSTSRITSGSTNRSASPQNWQYPIPSSQESIDKEKSAPVSAAPTTSPIQENVVENTVDVKKRSSSKARRARRESRQRDRTHSSSSSGEDRDRRSESRHRKPRKKKSVVKEPDGVLPPPLPQDAVLATLNPDMTKSLTSAYITGTDDDLKASMTQSNISTKSAPTVCGELPPTLGLDESFHSCMTESTTSTRAENENEEKSKKTAKETATPASTTTKPIDSPLSIDTVTAVNKPLQALTQEHSPNKKMASPGCISWDSEFELYEAYSDHSCMDDESNYSAVVHFVPKKKRPPVPGMWIKDGVQLISKNKLFRREPESHTTLMIWKEKRKGDVTKTIKREAKKPVKKEDPKNIPITTTTDDKKKIVFKPKRKSSIDAKDVERAMKEREMSPITGSSDSDKKDSKKEISKKPSSPKIGRKARSSSRVPLSDAKTDDPKKKAEPPVRPPPPKVESVTTEVFPKEEVVVGKEAVTNNGKTEEKSKAKEQENTIVPLHVKKVEQMTPPEKRRASKVMEKPVAQIAEVKKAPEVVKPKEAIVVTVTCSLVAKTTPGQSAVKKLVQKVKATVANSKPIAACRKPIPIAFAAVDRDLMRKRPREKCEKTLVQKSRKSESTSLSCKGSSDKTALCHKNLVHTEQVGGAQVIVVSAPIMDVNQARARLRCRATKPKKNMASMPCYTTLEKEQGLGMEYEKAKIRALQSNNGAHSDTEYDNDPPTPRMNREGSQAALILDEMRAKDPVLEWRKKNGNTLPEDGTNAIVLPDQSILEEYVKRKRGRLERLHSEPIPEHDETRSECDSPCNSTTSELIPACAVRVFERSPRGVPVITAPQKSRSRLSSCEAATPTAMLEAQQQQQHVNNFNSTPQGFLRHERRAVPKPILFEAPQSFDTPKTPLEAALQKQANQIVRRASLNSLSAYSEPGDCRDPYGYSHSRQNSQDSMGTNPISNSFTAALAANQPRHERYAAHIPVNRGDTSGRQSTTSIDSNASGALDTATKQLDQMIDQARHRHHQHRSKFKEAIDYLDQIFEDLKKECDPGTLPIDEDSNNNSKNKSAVVEPVPPVPVASSATLPHPKEPKRFAPVAAPSTAVPDPAPSNSYTSQSLPTRSHKHHRTVKDDEEDFSMYTESTPPSPVEVVLRHPAKPAKPTAKSPDTEVAETIVLPKKQDKLDFTRRWLADDLSAFSMSPAPLVVGPEHAFYHDLDEHSLGSCSAEVAAINENPRDKNKKKTSGKPKPHADVKPVKPQPYRPMPVYGAASSSQGPRQFPLDLEPPNSLSRVASYDRMSDRALDNSKHSSWRGGSQEPYQTLPVHPNDPRPSPSAFQNVSGFNRGSLRGSIRSLPDAGLVRSQGLPTPDPPRDPGLAIDALVAELELNTEEANAAEKRRSFPTSMSRYGEYEQPRPRQHPIAPRRVTQPVNMPSHHNGYQQPPPPSQPILPRSIRQPASKANLDDMANMLNNVASDFGSPPPPTHHAPHTPRSKPKDSNPPPFHKPAPASNPPNPNAVYAVPHTMQHSTPFETINKEKINPSRVEAMQSMFESRPIPAGEWRRAPQPYKTPSREEDTYYEINEFPATNKPIQPKSSPPRHPYPSVRVSPSQYNSPQTTHNSDYPPQYPTTQPPSYPPTGRNGSASSSQNGGYYSSNSSGHHPAYQQNSLNRRGSIVGKQSISSRAASVDDEDDGFYDNIQALDDRRFSRGSEMDAQSLNRSGSQKHGGNKIGSFFRKIGSGRPPGAAASLVSLNKAGVDTSIQNTGPLMKSSSFSQQPWNDQIIRGQSSRSPAGDKSKGIGQRLKNSLFGSKKRLNG